MPSLNLRRPVLIIVAATLLAGCGGSADDDSRVRVVAAGYPLTYAAQQLGLRDVRVSELAMDDAAAGHDVEPTKSQLRLLRDADVVLWLGDGVQPELGKVLADLSGDVRLVDVLAVDGVETDDSADGTDPHVWLDPIRFQVVVDAAADALAEAGIADAPRRGDNLGEELRAADTRYRLLLQKCETRTIAADAHGELAYLADRYDLRLQAQPMLGASSLLDARPADGGDYLDVLEAQFDTLRNDLGCTAVNPTIDPTPTE
ncbi:MAG: periplasmic solute binding protein [Thermoleophilia bacterium]|nr:periplasmic solute binding protein [Thermoleophilia bacterium]